MPSPQEIDRIAAAMNAHRPDWRVSSLVTFLTKHHAGRPYRDLAIAATAVATDPRTTTPNLLNEHGAWWVAAQTVMGETATSTTPRPDDPRCPAWGHEHELARNCRSCRAERLARPDGAPVSSVVVAITPEQAARNAEGAALVLKALHDETGRWPVASQHRDATHTTEPDARMRAAGDTERTDR